MRVGRQNLTGPNFRAYGYFVSTVGRDEETVKKYIVKQEEADRKYKQLKMLSWFYDRFERFPIQASGFAGGQ